MFGAAQTAQSQYTVCPPVPTIFTAIWKKQAPGQEPTGMNSHIPGSASIDPRQVGLDYPGPEDQSKEALARRGDAMNQWKKTAGPKSPILISPQGQLPKGMPKPPYIVRGVGNKDVRSDPNPWADVRVNDNKTKFKVTLPAVWVVPKGMQCPK